MGASRSSPSSGRDGLGVAESGRPPCMVDRGGSEAWIAVARWRSDQADPLLRRLAVAGYATPLLHFSATRAGSKVAGSTPPPPGPLLQRCVAARGRLDGSAPLFWRAGEAAGRTVPDARAHPFLFFYLSCSDGSFQATEIRTIVSYFFASKS